MIVMKFGGTSVEDAPAIRNVIHIVNRERHRQPVVVVSACARVTDALEQMAILASQGHADQALRLMFAQRRRHLDICDLLLADGHHESVSIELKRSFADLARRLWSISVLKELTPKSRDGIISSGESWSALLVLHALQQSGCDATWVRAETLIVTDAQHGEAEPRLDKTLSNFFDRLVPFVIRGQIAVTQGFIGATEDGTITTLGRGGSDFSAAIFGSLLAAEEIQIWTDVDGISSADPRLISQAREVRQLSYTEAERMAVRGANVLHPRTIRPAAEHGIPIRILNSKRPELAGSLITSRHEKDVFSVNYRADLLFVRLKTSLLSLPPSFGEWFTTYRRYIESMQWDQLGFQVLLRSDGLEAAKSLELFGAVILEMHQTICWATTHLWNEKLLGDILNTLAERNISLRTVFRASDGESVGFVVNKRDGAAAVEILHEAVSLVPQSEELLIVSS